MLFSILHRQAQYSMQSCLVGPHVLLSYDIIILSLYLCFIIIYLYLCLIIICFINHRAQALSRSDLPQCYQLQK